MDREILSLVTMTSEAFLDIIQEIVTVIDDRELDLKTAEKLFALGAQIETLKQ